MFCPYCGNETPDGGKFCINCGGNLETFFMKETAESPNKDAENSTELMELTPKNNALVLENAIVMVDNNLLEIDLLDRDEIEYFKGNYFENGKYSFPLGRYTVSYNEDIVMSINTIIYFAYVYEDTADYCKKRYNSEIHGWDDLAETLEKIYYDTMLRVATLTSQLLVSSGIMSYTEQWIQKSLIAEPGEDFRRALEKCAEEYDNVMSQYVSAEAAREMKKALSGRNGYIAGGFGFGGVLGGMAAAGVANAASGLAGSIKNGVAKASNSAKMNLELNKILKNSGILNGMLADIARAVKQADHLYRQACMIEYNVEISIDYNYNSSMAGLADNTMRYVSEKEVILKNLSEVLALMPLGSVGENALFYLAENFYDDREISEQLLELSNFLLLGEEVEEYIQKKKEDELQVIFKLPEKTIEDVTKKMVQLSEKSKLLAYDASKELQRLQGIKEKLLAEKERLLAEEKARQEHETKLKNLMKERISSAQKVDDALKTNNMALFGEMSASGDMVAEERYIQYYVMNIRNGNNKRLFDAIASQCGNNRAYDCIVGVCCLEGYGTIKNFEIAQELLLRASDLGCTYAKGYLARLAIADGVKIWALETARNYVEKALEQVSPYICAWEGKMLCKGTAEGGSNKVPNDYDKALFYTEYAYHCGMEEAKEVYRYLQEHSASEINSKRYTSDSSCYITTAVCNSFGKPDDCYELALFRDFRDSYLLKTSNGKQLVEEYYCMAPKIVGHIDRLPDRDAIYYQIWQKYLQRCMGLIQNNELENCKNVYVTMVKELEDIYL